MNRELFGTINGRPAYIVRDNMGRIVVSDDLMHELVNNTKMVEEIKEILAAAGDNICDGEYCSGVVNDIIDLVNSGGK